MKIIIIVVMCIMCLSGCSRLQAQRTNDYGLYSGVREGCKTIRIEKSAFGTIAAISLPFDFVLDTVLLPRDAIRDMFISNEFVTVEYMLAPGNEEVWGFVATDKEMPEVIVELNEAKARNEYLKKVITKKQQLEIQNWFAYPGNSLAVERGCDKVIKFTKIE
ncbi:MAG: YceK/YidQ family lipoprotein [Sedimentisphaerales bacterium]|nr:YceK/YidQ family lipoprotein [Sedimentisphaerales bacterium]